MSCMEKHAKDNHDFKVMNMYELHGKHAHDNHDFKVINM